MSSAPTKRRRADGEQTRAAILAAATKLATVQGLDGLSIGNLADHIGMSKSGLYAHFGSKQALQEAAVAYGQDLSAARARNHGSTKKGRRSYSEQYLSVRHRDNPGGGCTMAALGQEVARSTPELRAAFERGFEEILAAKGGDRKEAIFQTAALLGGVVLARAVQDRRLSEEILESVRQTVD